MSPDPVFVSSISDLFINLSAGWLGAAFIVPAVAETGRKVNSWILLLNLSFSIIFLILAVQLKRI